jgi:hypothetical protein
VIIADAPFLAVQVEDGKITASDAQESVTLSRVD